jgi:hypothetical protein
MNTLFPVPHSSQWRSAKSGVKTGRNLTLYNNNNHVTAILISNVFYIKFWKDKNQAQEYRVTG